MARARAFPYGAVHRRRDARSRHRLEPHRSARAHARRVVDDRVVPERAARARSETTELRPPTPRGRSHQASPGTADFLSRRSSKISQTRAISVRRQPAASSLRRASRAMSRSPGPPTPSVRAGASTPNGAACACTRRCAARGPTSLFTQATRSTRTPGSAGDPAPGRDVVEKHRDACEVEGRRNARRVPRKLRLQLARRKPAPVQSRDSRSWCSGTITR